MMTPPTPKDLSFTSFARALDALRDALEQPKNPYTRDATIQRFEYTFELAWKSLKRYLRAETGADFFNIKDLFRHAGRQGLLSDVEAWFSYLKGRNLTSHTYNEKTAEETYILARAFLPDAEALLARLEEARDNSRN